MTKVRVQARKWGPVIAALALIGMGTVGCGDDEDAPQADSTPDEATSEDDSGGTGASAENADRNDDGQVSIGYVVAGDRNDGAFYQGQAEEVTRLGEGLGWEVTVVDKVNPAAATDTFENLARQGADLVIGGGAELETGIAEAADRDTGSTLYVLLASFPPSSDGYATAGANENHAHYVGGAAIGLALAESDEATACVVAGPEEPFVRQMEATLEAGLAETNPDAELLVTYTGDFENASLASAAFEAQVAQGCSLLYGYLGGALPAVLQDAASAGVDIASTSIDTCGADGVVLSITYNPSFYLEPVLEAFEAGEVATGELFAVYGVDSDTGVGASLCDPTDEQATALDDVRAAITSGEVDPDEIAAQVS